MPARVRLHFHWKNLSGKWDRAQKWGRADKTPLPHIGVPTPIEAAEFHIGRKARTEIETR